MDKNHRSEMYNLISFEIEIESVNVIGKIKSFDEIHFNVKRNFWKFVSKNLALFNSESSS